MTQFQQKDLISLIEGSDEGNNELKSNEDNKHHEDKINDGNQVEITALEDLERECKTCHKCNLRQGANQVVFGVGNPEAALMLVGEGPGGEEDCQGVPFVGSAGKLLTRILAAVDIQREEVYITNIVKCRPPGNRVPAKEEIDQCIGYLKKQIELINPQIIVCLGSPATQILIDKQARITKVRGNWVEKDSRLFMPTFHPAALLRDPNKKRPVWDDFQKIAASYRELLPNREKGR